MRHRVIVEIPDSWDSKNMDYRYYNAAIDAISLHLLEVTGITMKSISDLVAKSIWNIVIPEIGSKVIEFDGLAIQKSKNFIINELIADKV